MLSGEAEQRRKDGQYSKDGVTYTRQEEQTNTPTGNKGIVKFADNVEQEYEYALVEEEELQPAHLNRKRNPLHFVPEMQPKNRKDQSSQIASDKIADNPKLDEAGENSNAYSGAPVVNLRGEVIQGNNRSEGLKKHYQRGGTKYKQQLIDNAAKFGFTPEQVQGMKNPVLVRRLKVNDAKAIELGNYDAKDIETGGARKIDPVTTSRRIPQQDKSKMTESIFENTDTETTLTEAIKQNFKGFFDKVRKYLNPAQIETVLGKSTTPTADGIQDLVKLVQQFLFDGASTDISEQFERLSYNAKQGLLKSLPNILSVSKDKSLLNEIQNAIVAVSDFSTSKIDKFEEWVNQTSMFEEQQTPQQKYTELELKIAELLINAKKQNEITNIFKNYTNLVKDFEGDMFEPARKGLSKQEAISKTFNINNNNQNENNKQPKSTTGQRANSKQDGANDPKGESKPRPEIELFSESNPNEQGAEQGVDKNVIPLTNKKTDNTSQQNKDVADVKEQLEANKEQETPKPKLTESEQVAKRHKGVIYKNPKDGYYYGVTGYNSGYYILKDLETGKVIKEKEDVFENDFIDVTYEVEQQNKSIQSESSGVQNITNYDVTQYQDNVFEVKESGNKNAPTYRVVVGKAFDLDSSTVTINGKPLAKNKKVPQNVLLAIQSHVDKFNPESKKREIEKFLNQKANKEQILTEQESKEILDEYAYKFPFEEFMLNYLKPFGKTLSIDVKNLIGLSKENSKEQNQTAIRDFYKKAKKRHSEKLKKQKQEALDLKTKQDVENIINIGLQAEKKMQQQIAEQEQAEKPTKKPPTIFQKAKEKFTKLDPKTFKKFADKLKIVFPKIKINTFNDSNVKEILGSSWENVKAQTYYNQINNTFNEQLQKMIDGTLKLGTLLQLGNASKILQASGIPSLPIELNSTLLNKKSKQTEHPFGLSDVKDLAKAIQKPLAVFNSSTVDGRKVVFTELQHTDNKGKTKNFVVALEIDTTNKDKTQVNDIRSVYPRNDSQIIKSINNETERVYVDKEKMLEWISKRQFNSDEVTNSNKQNTNLQQEIETAKENIKKHENPLSDAEINEVAFQVNKKETSLFDKYFTDKGIIDDKELLEKYNLKRLVIQNFYGIAHLNLIIAKDVGKGFGTIFMNDFIKWADDNKLNIALSANANFGATSKARLENFYAKFGFKKNKGKYKLRNTEEDLVRVQFLRTPQGTIYGFVKDGQIYINENELNANTLMHEYSHIFVQMLKIQYPQLYKNLIDRIKQEKDLIANKKKDPNYANLNEEQLADEVLADLVGIKGEQLLNAKKQLHKKLLDSIKAFWNKIKNLFTKGSPNIAKWSVDDFKNATLDDIVNNVTADLLRGRRFTAQKESRNNVINSIQNIINKVLGRELSLKDINVNDYIKYRVLIPDNGKGNEYNSKKLKKAFGETVERFLRSDKNQYLLPLFTDSDNFIKYVEENIGLKSNLIHLLNKDGAFILEDYYKKTYDAESNNKKIELKDPFELLKSVGYTLSNQIKDINTAKDLFYSYYLGDGSDGKVSGSIICTYNSPSRFKENIVMWVVRDNAENIPRANVLKQEHLNPNSKKYSPEWAEYLEKKGRKNADGTYNLSGLAPAREDPFGTSVLSIQIANSGGSHKTINRYNHDLQRLGDKLNPDRTFNDDLNKLAPNFEESLYNYYNVKQRESKGEKLPEGFVRDNNGKIFSYSKEKNGVYYGDGYYIKNGVSIILDSNKQRMMGGYVINQDGKIEDIANQGNFIEKNKLGRIDKVEFLKGNIVKFYTPNGELEIKITDGVPLTLNIDDNLVKNYFGDRLKINKNGLLELDKFTNKDDLFWNGKIEVILGDADFRDSQITSLGNLQYIGKNAYFSYSRIESLGDLQSIGGNADFRDSQITSLGNLQSIGGNAYFSYSRIESLGNLQSIGGNADFTNSQIQSLGNLQSIGGYADFRDSQIKSLGNLQSIGGNAYFENSQVQSLGKLQSIGESAFFEGSNITEDMVKSIINKKDISEQIKNIFRQAHEEFIKDETGKDFNDFLPDEFKLNNNNTQFEVAFDENTVTIDEQIRFQVEKLQDNKIRTDLKNDSDSDIRFQITTRQDTRPFETKNPTKATKENLQKEFPDAVVVQSESELPTPIQNKIRQQRVEGKVKGVFYNGEVYMVADNIRTIGEATGTYRHETLGHKGVMEYLGEKLNDYATRIIDNAKGGQLKKLQELAADRGMPTDLSKLTDEQKKELGEEYIAFISENKSTYPKAWNDLVSFVREMLRKLPFLKGMKVTDTEIQALIGKVEKMQKIKNLSNNAKNNDIRFQIIGEKGAARLENAVVVLENLSTAKQMRENGKDAKTIWLATGWEFNQKDKEGKGAWKTEIKDVNFKNIDIVLDAMLDNKDKTFTFEELFEKNEIYSAYENTKNITIKFVNYENSQTEAGYNAKENTIYINRQKFADYHKQRDRKSIINYTNNLSGLRRVFLHELEHFVQTEEGFAPGGSPNMFNKPSEYLEPFYQDIETLVKFSEEKNLTPLEAYNRLKGTFNNDDVASFNKNKTLVELKKLLEEKKNERLDPFERYKRLAGEVEARNVEKRTKLTLEERAKTLLSETEDVAEEDKIYLQQEVDGANEMMSIRFQLGDNKDLRLPQTVARQTLDQMKLDAKNKVSKNTMLENAINFIQNTDWYNNLDDNQKARVNKTALKSLLENSIKDTNYLEDKIADYKQQIRDSKMTTKQVFDDIMAFLKTNQIKGKITPIEINRLIRYAAEITTKKDTDKALDNFMTVYGKIKQSALLRSNKDEKAKAEYEYVQPVVEFMVANGKTLQEVIDAFDTASEKRMAEILYYKEFAKTESKETQAEKVKQSLEKQRKDLQKAINPSIRQRLKAARKWWLNLMIDRSYIPAFLMKNLDMEQSYYQFKNTKGYGYNAKEMYQKAYDKIFKGLTVKNKNLLFGIIQQMRIITIDESREAKGLPPIQHPEIIDKDGNKIGELNSTYARAFLEDLKHELGDKKFNDLQKRAKEYFKTYQEVLDLKLENGFITQETYDALNGLDYQPRMFLHHAVNFDGEFSTEKNNSIETRSGLSKKFINSLNDGSVESLILDAEWLLSNSIATLYQDIAENTLNKLFIAKELPIAQQKYDDILSTPKDERTKEDKRFIKYFDYLKKRVKVNEIQGFNEDGTPKYKDDKPNHFVKMYYWNNGIKHQFFMEEKLAKEFEQVQGLFLNSQVKEIVGFITGARLVKYFATGNNPLFIVVNFPRDFVWNIIVSEHYSSFVPLAIAQMTYQLFPATIDFVKQKLGYTNNDLNLYMSHGGSMDYLHKQGEIAKNSIAYKLLVKTPTSVFGSNLQPIVENKLRNNYLAKGIKAMNEWSEMAFRIATFRRSVNAQLKELGYSNDSDVQDLYNEDGSIAETRKERLDNIYRKATYDARSVLDFSQGGLLVKDLEEFIPYVNVTVQSLRSYGDAMKKRPVSTTAKTLQFTAIGTLGTASLALFMLSGDEDEPEKDKGKSSGRKYVEFMEGVSDDTRAKYFIIPTKKRDEEGNRIFYKIAKEHFLMPYFSLTEGILENRIRKENNMKEIPFDIIQNRMAKGIIENFGMKKSSTDIPVVSQAEMVFGKVKDVPLIKAVVSGYAGYDLYKNKPFDKYAQETYLEGMNNPDVEQFYKNLATDFKVSPIRMKNVVESFLTSPQTSPYLATSYEVLDYALTNKTMDNFGKNTKKVLLKGLELKTQGKSTEWMQSQNQLSQKEKENNKIKLQEYLLRQEFKDVAKQVVAGEITESKALKELEEKYKDVPNFYNYETSFYNEIDKAELNKNLSIDIQNIKREKSPGARANLIKYMYGDIYHADNKDILKKLNDAGVINDATKEYLKQK